MRLESEDLEVELLPELGGRWHRLRAFGNDVLRTPDERDAYRAEPFFWGSFVMAPWCNRVVAERQEMSGMEVELRSNFTDGTAIHGQVAALPWKIVGPGTMQVAAGGGGWPWQYEVTQQVVADGPRLRVGLMLTNRSAEPMPAGIGIHPWFVRPLEVELRADRVFTSNVDSSPQPEPVAGSHDLRQLRDMPPGLDATWTDLQHPEIARLRWPELEVAASLRVSREGTFLCAASPTEFAAVAVEAQTHAPDALRRLANDEPGAPLRLAPGRRLRLGIVLTFTRSGSG